METTTAETKVNEKAILNLNLKRIIIGLSEIGNLEIESFDTNYNITRTIANLNQVDKAYTKSLSAIQKKYIRKDDKGNLASENGYFIFNSDTDKESYTKEVEALEETIVDETKTQVWRLKASELQKIKGVKGTTMAKCHELIEDDINKK